MEERLNVVDTPPPNNGMHPTADTTDFMFRESLGAAGDAGRYVAD
jgi:hypothetical protein